MGELARLYLLCCHVCTELLCCAATVTLAKATPRALREFREDLVQWAFCCSGTRYIKHGIPLSHDFVGYDTRTRGLQGFQDHLRSQMN